MTTADAVAGLDVGGVTEWLRAPDDSWRAYHGLVPRLAETAAEATDRAGR